MKLLDKGLLILAFATSAAAVTGCAMSDKENAEGILKKMNYKIVEYEGTASPWDLGRGETYGDKFKVVAPGAKDTMEAIVTSGIFKPSTIRFSGR